MSAKGYRRHLKRLTKQRRRERLETTYSVGCGPLELDVLHARKAGWTVRQLERVSEQIIAMGKREFRVAHRNGPVLTCSCVVCDPTMKDADSDSPEVRASWRRRGLWPVTKKQREEQRINLARRIMPPLKP